MLFNLQNIRDLFPTYTGTFTGSIGIDNVMTDSRKKVENSLFIPIIGEQFDGHKFLMQAIDHGAIAAIWNEEKEIPEGIPASFALFFVEDTVLALQSLAKSYRETINPTVIGITGSNGKTTTKDLAKSVLGTSYKTHATEGNFNNEIGLPLSILAMEDDTEVLILEMGMNHFHEIERLSNIAQPNYAMITNIGESHIEFLGSRKGIAQAKLEIVAGLQENGILFVDGDEILLENILEHHIVTCGFRNDNTYHIENVHLTEDETTFELNLTDHFHIPLLGKHHAKNATYVIALAKELGLSNQTIQHGLNNLAYSEMRFERIQGKSGVTLINDAYNASATSMRAAIDVVKQIPGKKHRLLVLGDILELGEHEKELHRSVADVIDDTIIGVFTIGHHAKGISDEVKRKNLPIIVKHFTGTNDLIDALQQYLDEHHLILFKASRMMKFEKLVQACM